METFHEKYAKEEEQIFSLIEKNDSIVLFGHVFPDGDCYGSSEGLKYALKQLYPDKKIYVSSTDCAVAPYSFPRADVVSDEVIASSLHIICDVADEHRVGDQRAVTVKGTGTIILDHHIKAGAFGDSEVIDSSRGSCCDMIADMLYGRVEHLNPVSASCFALGIVSDTGRFLYVFYPRIYEIMKKLVEDGADIASIYTQLYTVRESRLARTAYYGGNYRAGENGVNWIFLDKDDCRKFGISGHSAALGVNNLSRIEASPLWAAFGEDEDGKVYGEFRSYGDKVNVQKIAKAFGGGGHFNASGCTLASKELIPEVIKACEDEALNQFCGDYKEELKTLIDLAKKASEIVCGYYEKGFKVEIKSDQSPVTDADKASDHLIRDTLKEKFPEYGILTEEDKDDFVRLEKKRVFVIDPLDGTSDFVAHDGQFAINLGLVEDHVPVVGVVAVPLTGEIYFAVKGQGSYYAEPGHVLKRNRVSSRLNHLKVLHSVKHVSQRALDLFDKHKDLIDSVIPMGAALKACTIARGENDCAFTYGDGTKEWDTCAPQIIVLEAGGIYTDTKGNVMTYNRKDVYNHDGYAIVNRKENQWNLE